MTQDDGSNSCLDELIQEQFEFVVQRETLDVRGKVSHYELRELGQSLGLTEEEMGACYLYMTYGLALNPLVCTLEPATLVTTLCEDGSSDLSQCPASGASMGRVAEVWWTLHVLVLLLGVIL